MMVMESPWRAWRPPWRLGWRAWRLVLEFEARAQLTTCEVQRLAVWIERAPEAEIEALIEAMEMEAG